MESKFDFVRRVEVDTRPTEEELFILASEQYRASASANTIAADQMATSVERFAEAMRKVRG